MTIPHVVGGVRAKKMHDEDNKYGIWVKSKKYPEPWIAYGDDTLSNSETHKNRAMEAVKASLDDVSMALKGEKVAYIWKTLIPDPLEFKKGLKPGSQEWENYKGSGQPVNYEPMYYVKDGKVVSRTEFH